MMETELYLNDELMDLAPDTVIALTLQVNDLSNLQDRQGSFSNSIALPKTDRNRKILEFAEQISSFGNSPYRKISAKYKRRGAELISAGFAIIEDTQDNFDVTVYYSNALFFTNLQGLNLIDLDLTAYNFNYYFAWIADHMATTDGVIYPVIDYTDDGLGLKNSQPGDLGTYLYMQINTLYPAFYVHTLFKEIFKQAGYGLGGKIFSDPKFLNLLLPYSKSGAIQYSSKQIAVYTSHGIITTETNLPLYQQPPATQPHQPDFTNIAFIPDPAIPQVNYFTNDNTLTFQGKACPGSYWLSAYNIHVDINLTVHLSSGRYNKSDTILIVNFNSNAVLATLPIDLFVDPFQGTDPNEPHDFVWDSLLNLQTTLLLPANEKIGFVLHRLRYGLTGAFYILDYNIKVANTKVALSLNPAITIGDTLPIFPQSIFDDMSQTDFIKSICNMFGLIPQFDVFTNTMNFVQFTELYDNRSMAKDWTGKIDQSIVPKTEYRIGSYGQNTWARYKHDDTVDVSPVFTPGNTEELNYGDGKFIVDDKTLPLSVDMITLPYAGTRYATWQIGNLANIKLLENIAPKNSVQQRILMGVPITKTIRLVNDINSPNIGDPFYYVQRTSVNIPYFNDPFQDINLGFDNNLLVKQYAGLSDQMLKQVKMVTAYFKLSITDISLIDHFVPIYLRQYGAYFYINQIVQYVDETSSVQAILIRM